MKFGYYEYKNSQKASEYLTITLFLQGVRIVQEYIIYIVWQVVYGITCYIRIIYILVSIDISESFYDEIADLKEVEYINRTNK